VHINLLILLLITLHVFKGQST